MSEADPMGVADPPDTTTMQRATDALRGLLVGDHDEAYRKATIRMAVEIMELQTDWLLDQHRLIKAQSEGMGQLNELLVDLRAMVRQLLGKPPE